jgi:hypothetical protein
MKSRSLLNLCRDQDCRVRLPGICNFDPATTVPAHIRQIGISGAGLKASDLFACPACSSCHDAIDRRAHMELDRDYVQLAHYKALVAWWSELERREVITVMS